jgi:hypothetical protein
MSEGNNRAITVTKMQEQKKKGYAHHMQKQNTTSSLVMLKEYKIFSHRGE